MTRRPDNEAPITEKARDRLTGIFKRRRFEIIENVPLPSVTNNMGEPFPQDKPYTADMILTKEFIIELDSKKLHGTKIKRNKDKWRDTNIMNQMDVPTVRLLSTDVMKQSEKQIIAEINHQLDRARNKDVNNEK